MAAHPDTKELRFLLDTKQRDALKRHAAMNLRAMNDVLREALALYALAKNEDTLLEVFTFDETDTDVDVRDMSLRVPSNKLLTETVLPMCERLGCRLPAKTEV